MPEQLNDEERALLLRLARQAMEVAVSGQALPPVDLTALPPALTQPGATFVTLTRQGALRGCIGTLEAHEPLAEDVRRHAIEAALRDPRFPPVTPAEAAQIEIEISRLTAPQDLDYAQPTELPQRLRPHIDGVTLHDGWRRATFLPQVWDALPDPQQFLDHLCEKMGAPAALWRTRKLHVQTYQVEEFHESRPQKPA